MRFLCVDGNVADHRLRYPHPTPTRQQAQQLQATLAGLSLDDHDTTADPTTEPLPLSAGNARLLVDLERQLRALRAAAARMEEGGGSDEAAAATATGSERPLEGLDDVLLVQALVFLPAADIARARRASRRLLRVASGRAVWQPLCRREWPWIDQLASSAAGPPLSPLASVSSVSSSSSSSSSLLDPTAHCRLYRQRALARRLVRPPPPRPPTAAVPTAVAARKPLSDLELCVDLWIDGEVWWSARGPLPADEEAFRAALFSFNGFVLEPAAVVGPRKDRPLLFAGIADVLNWFNDNAVLRLDFTLLDTKTGRMADLSSVLRRTALTAAQQQQEVQEGEQGQQEEGGAAAAAMADMPLEGTRASIGWDSTGQGNVDEVWVFSSPDNVFLQGEIRMLRGLTLRTFGFRTTDVEGKEVSGVGVNVVSAWMCDHQYLGGPKPSVDDVRAVIFEELKWV